MQKKKHRILKRVLWSVVLILVLAVGGTLAWTQIGVMPAEEGPLAEARSNPAITIEDTSEGIVLSPADGVSETGLVFIPGAKVRASSSPPLTGSRRRAWSSSPERRSIPGRTLRSFKTWQPTAPPWSSPVRG